MAHIRVVRPVDLRGVEADKRFKVKQAIVHPFLKRD